VIRAVRTCLHEQERSWYREGMNALVSRWRKAVDVDGDYVKKITRVKETSSYNVREFHTF
jgi:23S rRNA maturation mini-RNase III